MTDTVIPRIFIGYPLCVLDAVLDTGYTVMEKKQKKTSVAILS